jgi:two-component system response regulator BaeR
MTAPVRRILIVEDEPVLASIVADYLREAGMEAEILTHGARAAAYIRRTAPDLVILDVMLPGKDGLTICREVRAFSNVPIIFQTARTEEIDRLLGLELGGDDYVCKPFSPRELVARVKSVLRRTSPGAPIEVPRLALDAERWTVALDGLPVDLTRREFQVLAVLVNRPGRVFSRAQILDGAFPDDSAVIDRTIDSHIKNIRAKVKARDEGFDPIRSVYGVGYAYEP